MTSEKPTHLKLSVLVPVRNEGLNIKIMLKVLHAMIEVPHEILFVYDQPDDDCIKIVNSLRDRYPNACLVHNLSGVGVVNALRAGVSSSQGEYILIFAVDELGPVMIIDDMLHLMDQGCDLVSCTRYAHGGKRLGGTKIGHLLSWIGNRLFFYLFKSALTDCTTGVKMFRKSIFNEINLVSRPVGWAVAFEFSIKAQLQGFELGEVPVISIDRLFGGKSTFRLGPWFFEYFRWFIWGIKTARLTRKKKFKPALVRLPNYYG